GWTVGGGGGGAGGRRGAGWVVRGRPRPVGPGTELSRLSHPYRAGRGARRTPARPRGRDQPAATPLPPAPTGHTSRTRYSRCPPPAERIRCTGRPPPPTRLRTGG